MLPYFKKSERSSFGEEAYRGREGPLVVEQYRTILPLTHRFVEAAQQAGFPFSPDLNGDQQEGVGYSQMTRRHRRRASTARTFLAEAKARSNLHISPNSTALGLRFEGKRCVGVGYLRGGEKIEARARREVIVSGGAVNSPHLLHISGIGPGAHLQSIGARLVHDLPGVGRNLQDHYVGRVTHRVRNAVSTNQLSRGWRLAREAARWVLLGEGALTFGVTTAQVFCRSREELASPDIQLLFTPASYDRNVFGTLEREPGMTAAICPTRPSSRGTIMAASTDPLQAPAIKPGYLSDEDDYRVLEAGMAHARRIFASPAVAQHSVVETSPGPEVQSSQDLRDFFRRACTTIYHPVGTCKMGEDPMAVVDSRLRVHGIECLRVIDASVMPVLTTGNTNAPTIMIGEKGAAMIKEDARRA